MIRRTFLKALCASPLGFLVKKKDELTVAQLLKCKDEIDDLKKKPFLVNTMGTSSNSFYYYLIDENGTRTLHFGEPDDRWIER
jgi:hypothetical protein